MPAVPLDEVKAHLQMSLTPSAALDVELADFIDAAETRLAHEVGPLTPTAFVETHRGPGPIVLRRRPVVSVETVNGAVVGPGFIDLDAGIIHTPYVGYGYGYGARTVAYTAGYSPLPFDIRQGVLELVRHLWTTQRGTGASGARAQMLGETVDATPGMSYTLPNRVMEMIRPYIVSGFA